MSHTDVSSMLTGPRWLRHVCPECGKGATMHHLFLPIYGHTCLARSTQVYWTDQSKSIWLRLDSLIHFCEQSQTDDAA